MTENLGAEVWRVSEGGQKEPVRPARRVHVDFDPPLLVCLSLLFGLKGKPLSTDVLKAGFPQDGSSFNASLCIRAAEHSGMYARTLGRQSVSRISPLVLPCILLLNNNNACVLTEIADGRARVLFPETGTEATLLPLEELQAEFTGYAIFGQLRAELDSRASDLKIFETKTWFWGTILRFWPIYKHVIMATLMINLLALASPLFVMNVYDRVVPNAAFETLWVLAIGIFVAYLFDFVLKNLRGYFVDTAGKNADIIIASRLMQQVMGMRLDSKPESAGSLASNMREFESLREFFSSSTLLAFVDLPFVVIFIAVIAYVGGPLALIPALAVPLVATVGFFLQFPFQKLVEAGYRESAQKNALLIEIITGLEAIKINLVNGHMQRRWEKVVGQSARSGTRAKVLATFSVSFSSFTAQFVSVALIVWGVYLIAAGELTMGGLIACNILLGRVMAPLGSIAAILTRLQQSRMALKALDSLMKLPSEHTQDSSRMRHTALENSLAFEDVSFHYPQTEHLALSGLSFSLTPGEKVGIIGRIGHGKSTLSKLLLGLYQAQKGAVKVGGVDVRQLDIADLRSKIGYVAQDASLFYGSVRDNIGMGQPYADDAAIFRAAELAGVTDFIKVHPSGFAMQVGERGQNLSGGQRQCVALAQVLLRDPDILVLDEPTNAMDNATEALIRRNLSEICKDKTLLLITHRTSMLSMVDRLIVMDRGRVVADGPKQSVLDALKNDRLRTVKP